MCSGPTVVAALEVGDGAGDAEDAAVASGAEAVAVVELVEQPQRARRRGRLLAQQARRHLGVAGHAVGGEAVRLALARGDDALADGGRRRAPARRAAPRPAGGRRRRARRCGPAAAPDRRRWWRERSAALQRQRSSPIPHGHGLDAATSMKRVGNAITRWPRTIVTRPSSSGWRSASRLERTNSDSSSRNSTPWWASVASPGRGRRAAADQAGGRDRVVGRAERPRR